MVNPIFDAPCEGTAYNGVLHTDGSVGWKKEICLYDIRTIYVAERTSDGCIYAKDGTK
ncbi:MAG: hypothetical protein ACRD8W_08775 [Nitrososphaeraceae archaeon]